MVVLATFKNKEDLKTIKAQHLTHCKSIEMFPDAQGRLNLLSEVRSGRNLNSSEYL